MVKTKDYTVLDKTIPDPEEVEIARWSMFVGLPLVKCSECENLYAATATARMFHATRCEG